MTSRSVALSCTLLICTLGCRSEPEPSAVVDPPAAAAPVADTQVCVEHRAALREQQCGDEPDCQAPELPCTVALDLDGDGRPDQVELARERELLVLRVRFGDGREQLVGADQTPLTELPDLGEAMPPPGERALAPDWSWLASWSVAEREGEELVVGRHRFAAGPARGDGLWLSSSDTAAMLVLGEQGWLVIELGY